MVVLVLSIARGFLCHISVGFYCKQIDVKPYPKCLHGMFDLFHPFWYELLFTGFSNQQQKSSSQIAKAWRYANPIKKTLKAMLYPTYTAWSDKGVLKPVWFQGGGVLQAEINSHFLQKLPEVKCWFTLGKWAEWESCLLLVQCDCTQTCAMFFCKN